MIDSRQNENDYLGRYLNPEGIEKAPEGLTEKIMSHIQVEQVSLKVTGRNRLNVMVPVISTMTALVLIVFTLLFTSNNNNQILSAFLKYVPKLKFTMPEFPTVTFSGLNLPAIVTYIAIGLFILMLQWNLFASPLIKMEESAL